jgi:hypothetical protein
MEMMTRCTTRGCPVRYSSGPDRPCLLHREDRAPSLSARIEQWTGLLEAAPGFEDPSDGNEP